MMSGFHLPQSSSAHSDSVCYPMCHRLPWLCQAHFRPYPGPYQKVEILRSRHSSELGLKIPTTPQGENRQKSE
jgi:hypothetical protein